MIGHILELHRLAAARADVIGLAGALPADELLPRAQLERVLTEAACGEGLQYGWPEGTAMLRQWVVDRLALRGARIDPDQVIITSGAQQAIALAAAALPNAARVEVGAATYPSALAAFEHAGVRCALGGPADVEYLVAGVANPHGIDLVEPRRAELLASSRMLIIDEAYAELRFDGQLHRPLIADVPERVWHIGTISKTTSPGLRIGWLIPPRAAHAELLASKQAADLQTGSFAQAMLISLLATLDYDAMLDRARHAYAERAARLCTALHARVPGLRFAVPEGGFSIWAQTDEAGDDIVLLEDALAAGVSFDPGSMFRPDGASDPVALRLSFSHVPLAELDPAARRLASALEVWRRRIRRRRAA